jgi:hypothetical protein
MSVVAAGVLAILVAIRVDMPLPAALTLLIAGVLALLWGAASRRVAVRVDARGVTLGGSRLHYRGTTTMVPWAEITSILLWQQILPPSNLVTYLGLERRPAPTTSTSSNTGRCELADGRVVTPDVPEEVVAASRPISGWQLDRRGLARAVAGFAPEVWVLDCDTGQRVTADMDVRGI